MRMLLNLDSRKYFLLLFLFVLGLLLYGYYLQYFLDLFPCNLCILQRFGFIGVLFFSLIAFIHNPDRLGERIYKVLIILAAGAFNALFYASGDCAKVDWTFLGFSIAEWSVVMFFLIIISAIYMFFNVSKSL